MNHDSNKPGAGSSGRADLADLDTELDLDDTVLDVNAAMRAAVAAVEQVEHEHGHGASVAAAAAVADNSELEKLREEVVDLRDRSTRTLADFDNYRKRIERERDEFRRYAALETVREFVAVVDNLDRALSAGVAGGTFEDLKVGLGMILRQVSDVFRRLGVVEIQALDAPFDPAVHEAVAREESEEVSVPTVSAELQRGYKLHDRLVRPAMVKVAVPIEKKA
jgi:molecular chaperone GrpE